MQESSAVRNNARESGTRAQLVRHLDELDWHPVEGSRWACAFGSAQGTKALSLHVIEVIADSLEVPPQRDSESVLHVLTGRGSVSIAGRSFPISENDGIYVRMGESLLLKSQGNGLLRVLLAICPSRDTPWRKDDNHSGRMADGFDTEYPTRVVSAKSSNKEITGDRYFRILVDSTIGSRAITQFIGSIPLSRTPEHFHLYEEVIYVLSGEGRIWLGDQSKPVRPGSLVFLPRKQPHCMECTTTEGLELLGMFYPSGSPAVNYKTDNEE